MNSVKINYLDLAFIIEGIYYDSELNDIEELIDYLRNNSQFSVVLNRFGEEE